MVTKTKTMTARDKASMRITNVYRAYRDRFDAQEAPVEVMADMMSDLMHLADAFGSNGSSVAARAERRYREEADGRTATPERASLFV